MTKNVTNSIILKGSEVLRVLGMGETAGYRYLKHLEKNSILKPVFLPGIKAPRYRRDEIEELAKNKEPVPCEKFYTNNK